MATGLSDIPNDVVQTHILPRLDGASLSTTAAVSSHLQTLCSDDTLWFNISKSTWPSITHPRVADVINTFPSGHRSFFEDSFPALLTDANHYRHRYTPREHPDLPSEFTQFISAVDIKYRNDNVYSAVQFTNATSDFLSSVLQIEFSDDPTCNQPGSGSKQDPVISKPVNVEVDELTGADQSTLSDLEQSISLSWIIIDPTRKRSGNISSIKPVTARQDWMGNDTILRFVTVLPGSDPNDMVQVKIQLVLGVNVGSVGLHVKHVMLKLQDLNFKCLDGREFLVITAGAFSEENNVRRKVMDDKERWSRRREFKRLKLLKKEWDRMEEDKREFAVKLNYVVVFLSFFFMVYFLILLLQS
ncbi:F-box protein At2g27310-like [Bidens hawaiensis]|uniref:F-box protein At2g27310-like n=1 Tax=Bidens hawaiensis TaxID=980011 RepID=UPI00404946A6